MIYTSYFAMLRKIPKDNMVFLSIARYTPKGIDIKKYDRLIPPKGLIDNYKGNKFYTEERYTEDYYRFILNERDPLEIAEDLDRISKGKDVVLLCFEKSEDFCHRHIVREWLNKHGIKCCEWRENMQETNYKSTSDHTKYYNSENKEVPSVTTILKVLNKPSLVHWANWLGMKRENVDKVLEKSAYIGTMVHRAIEADMLNTKFTIDGDESRTWFIEVPEYFKQYKKWRETNDIEVIATEEQMTCDKFGGTCDLYCIYNDKKTIIDYKTSKGVYSSMFFQLGAYTYMRELRGETVEQCAILTVNKDKCYITIKSREEMQKYIDGFLKIADLYMMIYGINNEDGWKQEF